MKHSELRNYGFNKIIKEYAGFPQYLPLPCHSEHGWTVLPNALKSDLVTDKPLMLVFSKRREKLWKKASDTPVLVAGAPFVHYKNMRGLKQKASAKGTVVFPSHSTMDLKIQFSVEDYCRELKKLPKIYHPITICLFWLDYISPRRKSYLSAGFKVVTAGPKITNSLSFVNNFYRILSDHRYATGNEVGTSMLYSVDFGLPFFITGPAPTLHNLGKRDINVNLTSTIYDYEIGKSTTELFSTGPVTQISSKQREFVDRELGTTDSISGPELKKALWKYYKQANYGMGAAVMYWLTSIPIILLFNMPWTGLVFRIRNNLQPWLIKFGSKT